MDAGNDKFAQFQILLRDVQVVLMIEDIRLDPPVDPDPLHLPGQHPLAVGNEGGRAALHPRRMLCQTQALHALIPCSTAVFPQSGPGVAGQDGVGMGVHLRRHFSQLHKIQLPFLFSILTRI